MIINRVYKTKFRRNTSHKLINYTMEWNFVAFNRKKSYFCLLLNCSFVYRALNSLYMECKEKYCCND